MVLPSYPLGKEVAEGDEISQHQQDPVTASDLPEPESTAGWIDLPRHPPRSAPTPKGVIGAIARTVQKIPACVWVVNQHTEEITVVVSKYRPNRLFSGGGISASTTGAGLNFTTTTFLGPASKKTLAPRHQDRERSMAVFPLWTRKEGFGVISVFTGPEQVLYIENDRVPLGATAYFENKPDLRIREYDSR